eukprot:snap_masked-scaffold_36-processed-gene-0.26-mRNA-1 protein AED:1.00 eAED:1.00 QI:0/-1/0/0/-1/1/1/0/73
MKKILLIKELYKNGFEKLKVMASVSPVIGRWFSSKQCVKVEIAATFLAEELTSQLTDAKVWSNRIMELSVKLK